MKQPARLLLLTGWLIPAGLALIVMASWIKDILVPTLKGRNFEQLYDLHGIRYLDTTLALTMIAFVWFSVVVFQWARKHVARSLSEEH